MLCCTAVLNFWFTVARLLPDSPGEVHNMFRVWVCAAHMGGFLGPKYSRQGSLFRQIFLKQGWVVQKLAKNSKKVGGFPPKVMIKVGMTASFGN